MKYGAAKIIKYTVLAIAGILLLGYVVFLLWNWLMPDLFHLGSITFLQSLGILLLSKILFGGFKGNWYHKNWNDRKKLWRERMEAKMSNMSAEEKERFKQELAKRCGCEMDSE